MFVCLFVCVCVCVVVVVDIRFVASKTKYFGIKVGFVFLFNPY